jgi:hypothetical protein
LFRFVLLVQPQQESSFAETAASTGGSLLDRMKAKLGIPPSAQVTEEQLYETLLSAQSAAKKTASEEENLAKVCLV